MIARVVTKEGFWPNIFSNYVHEVVKKCHVRKGWAGMAEPCYYWPSKKQIRGQKLEKTNKTI